MQYVNFSISLQSLLPYWDRQQTLANKTSIIKIFKGLGLLGKICIQLTNFKTAQ